MKKIIFGITSLTLGGAERVLIDLANKLVEKFDITIFTLYANGELEKELDERIHLKSLYNKRYKDLNKKERVLIPVSVLFNKRKIYKNYVDDNDYIAQIAFLEGAITRIFSVKSKHNTKKIAWIHNDISKVFGKSIKAEIKRIVDRNAYEKYDVLAFVSVDNLDKFNKVYDDMLLPHEKVIKNYINSERIIELSKKENEKIFNSDEVNIVQVSRLVEQKGIERLIDVHTKLIKAGYNHHIYIIGEGPLKTKLEEKIKVDNVGNTFALLGAKENPYPYIKDADAFGLFSFFEGYPMVVEEAKILKKFVVVTNTSAREVLFDYARNSLIVNNDEEGIEQGIKYIIENKKKILEKNNDFVYENNKIIDKIVKVIEEENVKKWKYQY